MKFDQYLPTPALRPYIRHLVISEHEQSHTYKVFPSTGMVVGFQYRGRLLLHEGQGASPLHQAGITGMTDGYRVFEASAHIGTVLVYFTEVGFAFFSATPARELFNLSVSLYDVFDQAGVSETEDRLAAASTDAERIASVTHFLLSQLRQQQTDRLIVEAVRRIYAAQGHVRIRELATDLHISQSPFEKRFRKLVGTTPKKFASIVRFHAVLDELGKTKSLTEICYENHFFDQAHFIRDFKKYTGDTPESFRKPE